MLLLRCFIGANIRFIFDLEIFAFGVCGAVSRYYGLMSLRVQEAEGVVRVTK